jgi:poly(A) polymerase
MRLTCASPEILLLQKLVRANKLQAFLVGGFWRDQMTGRSGRDLDFAVSKDAIKLAQKFARAIKGAFVLLDKESGCARVARKRPDGLWTYDFADFRAKTIKADLARRDFTINTFAVDIFELGGTGKPLSHPKAAADIRSKTIRMASAKAFKDDPLRLLRAYSLSAQLGFKIERATLAALKLQRALIKKASPERIREELFKVLASPRAAAVIRAMDRDGIFFEIMPQVRVMYGVVQGGYHHLNVWEHSLEVLAQFEKIIHAADIDPRIRAYLDEEVGGGHARRAIVKLACLLHDIGKPDTLKKEPGGRTSFHGHEHVGKRIVRIIARQLILSTKERYALEDMVLYHLRPGYLSNFKRPSEKAVFRYFRDTKAEAVSILLLCMADQRSTLGPLTTAYDLEHSEAICRPLIKKYFAKKSEKPFVRLIGGNDLIKELKLEPGPLFKKLLAKVDEAQQLGKITTKAEALAFVKRSL